MAIKKEDVIEVAKFSKEQLLKSKIFTDKKDVLNAIIKDNDVITLEEAKTRLDKFMNREVK